MISLVASASSLIVAVTVGLAGNFYYFHSWSREGLSHGEIDWIKMIIPGTATWGEKRVALSWKEWKFCLMPGNCTLRSMILKSFRTIRVLLFLSLFVLCRTIIEERSIWSLEVAAVPVCRLQFWKNSFGVCYCSIKSSGKSGIMVSQGMRLHSLLRKKHQLETIEIFHIIWKTWAIFTPNIR